MRTCGVKAQTSHNFFRWSGQTEWTPERMDQKFIPSVISWDEICTVTQPILEIFLNWHDHRGVQIVWGQPPPIVGEMPHDWLKQRTNYYEEVEVDHSAKDPDLKALKKRIRLQPDMVQRCERRSPAAKDGIGLLKPGSQATSSWPRDRKFASEHRSFYSCTTRTAFKTLLCPPVPPQRQQKQNIQVTIPGTDRREELDDTVDVSVEAAEAAIQTDDSRLGYVLSIHSSQGLTIHDPQKVWIIDDYLQGSNLGYLAVSWVEYMRHLKRVVSPQEEDSEVRPAVPATEEQLRKTIAKKLVAYKRQDQAKGFRL